MHVLNVMQLTCNLLGTIKSASLHQVTMSSYAISMESQEPLVSIKFCFITLTFLLGRHCCLWCTITSDQLIVPKASRQPVTVRTLDHLAERYSAFLADGGNLKKAKFHCNVIGETLFNIPLTQVKSEHFLLTS